MSPDLEALAEQLARLPLVDALKRLVELKILNFAGKGLGRIKKIIQDKQNEAKYAFVPSKEEAQLLKRVHENPQFREVQLIVPKYKHIDLIRTGLLLDYYNKNNTLENRKRSGAIKFQISKRPNGSNLQKIAKLPTTPFFSIILRYLLKCKVDYGYSKRQLEDKFSELVQKWKDSSMLVRIKGTKLKPKDTINTIAKFCEGQIDADKEYFFILGMYGAADLAEDAIKKLEKDKYLEETGYIIHTIKNITKGVPRTEITICKPPFEFEDISSSQS